MSARHVYNIPSGQPFLPLLADGLARKFGDELSSALILLPTRRAVQGLRKAFADRAREQGLGASLLPRMKPLADINPDEPPFEPFELAGQALPAISPLQRRFEMAKLVAHYHRRAADLPLDPASALALADPLLAIMDDAAMEEVELTATKEWKNIIAESAAHFQHAAKLYEIIDTYWPARLKELGRLEPQARKVMLLNQLTEYWHETPPDYPVIIAGSTGTLKATAALMDCVSQQERGMVILPGLQMSTDQIWDSIGVQHPQASLKALLETMKLDRGDVADWRGFAGIDTEPSVTDLRRIVINEALVAVDKTSGWLSRITTLKTNHGEEIFREAMAGLSLIEAPNDADEAMSIALILREVLEEAGKTAALVTPDQNLAQRVRAAMRRWGVDIGMSQGLPLAQQPVGTFLSALSALTADPDSPVALSVICNHPLTTLDETHETVRAQWQAAEQTYYRGLRPTFTEDKPLPDIIHRINAAIAPLTELDEAAPISNWASALAVSAEAICGPQIWQGAAGTQAYNLLEGLIAHGAELPDTNPEGLQRLIYRMMQNSIVRSAEGNQPRLSILGPLEARLIHADVIILGGLNEGVWPSTPSVDPYLSRSMRREMELSLPERRYGLSAHDFAELAANKKVYLTRSTRSDSGPMVASRWVWRLTTLLAGALGEDEADALLKTGNDYLHWAQKFDHVPQTAVTPAEPPDFKPPVKDRWGFRRGKPDNERRISITKVQDWIRDPYSIFARRVLGLEQLDDLDMAHDARSFGTAMHDGIEQYLEKELDPISDDQVGVLLQELNASFAKAGYAPHLIAHEAPRLTAIAEALINWLQGRRALGYDYVGTEIGASHHLKGVDFRLTGQIDLVERSPQGLAILDFKTGYPSTAKVVNAGFDPQLPLSAFLAEQGGLFDVPATPTEQLGYVRVKGSNDGFEECFVSGPDGKVDRKPAKDAMTLAGEAENILRELIKAFDDPTTAYPSQPRAQYQNKYGDFDHLARRAEWRGIIRGEGEG